MSRLISRRAAAAQAPPAVVVPPSGLVVAPPVGPFTVFDGNFTAAAHPSCFVRTDQATTIQKFQCQEYTDYGIGAMQFYPPTNDNPGRTLCEDCIANNITRTPPRSSNGTAEAGFWFGNPTTARRLYTEGCGWMGMWTGSKCYNSIFEDFKIVQGTGAGSGGVGLYVEHVTRDSQFRRFSIQTTSQTGINIEWWYGGAGSSNLLFEDGEIYCPPGGGVTAGIFADAGTFGCTFRRIRFWGPGNAIGLPNNLVSPVPNVVESCVFENSGSHVFYHNNGIG